MIATPQPSLRPGDLQKRSTARSSDAGKSLGSPHAARLTYPGALERRS